MGSSPSTTSPKIAKHKNQKLNNRHKRHIHEQMAMGPQDIIGINQSLKTHCLFCHIPASLRQEYLQKFKKYRYSFGSYIYKQNDVSLSLYLIKDGGVYYQVFCDIVKTISEGEYFGHDTLCFDAPRNQSIRVASQEIVIYQLKKQDFMNSLKDYMQTYRSNIDTSFNRIHFFNYLTNKQRQIIVENTFLFRCSKGQVLFEKEQNANSFYIINKGTISIQITGKKDIIMHDGDYFGQSAFFTLTNNSTKCQRMGRALANEEGVELYAVGLIKVKEALGSQIRSIIFFNQEKWALYRDPFLASLKQLDINYLLQLFSVKQCKKFTILAKKETKPKYLFIPLQVEINANKNIQLYCSQYLKQQNKDKLLSQDIILTDSGYYAYALISEFKQVLLLKKQSQNVSEVDLKLNKQPMFKTLTLTLRNISKYSKKIPSSIYSTVLIVQDMKFGCEFIIKIYNKRCRQRKHSFNDSENQTLPKNRKVKTIKTFCGKGADSSLKETSRPSSIKSKTSNRKGQKQQVDERIVERQRNILLNLKHPSICGYYKSQQDQKHYYLFLQYILGLTLDEVMTHFGIIPQSIIKYILASLIMVLDHLHTKNIIYRNLNPSNIMISDSGRIVITDFSCAKVLGQNGRTNTVVGVPYYIAPQVIKEQEYTFNVDIWSIGVVLYQIMTGSLPFGQNSQDVLEVYESIMWDSLDIKKLRNRGQRPLIQGLLERDSAKRMKSVLQIRKYAYMGDLQFDWPSFLSNKIIPFYFPIKKSLNYTNFNNYELFDASTAYDWN